MLKKTACAAQKFLLMDVVLGYAVDELLPLILPAFNIAPDPGVILVPGFSVQRARGKAVCASLLLSLEGRDYVGVEHVAAHLGVESQPRSGRPEGCCAGAPDG